MLRISIVEKIIVWFAKKKSTFGQDFWILPHCAGGGGGMDHLPPPQCRHQYCWKLQKNKNRGRICKKKQTKTN